MTNPESKIRKQAVLQEREKLLQINGHPILDVLDYRFYGYDSRCSVVLEKVCSSALEIARKAGWDDSVLDIETRVRTAISALEQGGYLERGNNVPHVYATGITVKNMDEARKRITESVLFESEEVEKAVRIIKSLISQKNIAKAQDAEAESYRE